MFVEQPIMSDLSGAEFKWVVVLPQVVLDL